MATAMAIAQLVSPSTTMSSRNIALFRRLRPLNVRFSSVGTLKLSALSLGAFCGLVVKAATIVSPKHTSMKPLGDRVLVKTKEAEEKTEGGFLLPSTALGR